MMFKNNSRSKVKKWNRIKLDLVYFITGVPDKSVTQAKQMGHEYVTSAKRATRIRHKPQAIRVRTIPIQTSGKIATRLKMFRFDSNTSENIVSNLHISYRPNERLHGEEKFHSKNYLLQMPPWKAKCVWKVHRKNWT